MLPLAGIRVLDFSTLLPGPMAGLFLVEAGAEVIKIERPGTGDEMRSYSPRFGEDSANFALLNRGKRSIAIDAPGAVAQLTPLVARRIFERQVSAGAETIPAPIDPALRDSAVVKSVPRLGADSGLVGIGA
jgi:hypothetical protein